MQSERLVGSVRTASLLLAGLGGLLWPDASRAVAEQARQLWLRDLAQCMPVAAVSRDARPGTWLAVDYEVDEGPGVMLFALPGSEPPALTFKLNAIGWCEVRLGFFYGADAGGTVERYLCAKLSKDPAFSRFGPETFRSDKDGNYPDKTLRWFDLAEVFWKCADLTGQDLVIAGPGKGEMGEFEGNLALRIGDWKLVSEAEGGGKWELYDLTNDRIESRDLSGQYPGRVEEMVAAWGRLDEEFRRQSGAPASGLPPASKPSLTLPP